MPNPEPPVLTDRVRAFLDEPHFASLSTVNPDSSPHQAIIWYRLDADGRLLMNSRDGRRWPANLRRDGRLSLAVFDEADPNRWVGLTAEVDEVVDDVERARDDICDLGHRYGDDSESTIAAFRTQPRVTFLARIARVHDHLDD